MKIVIEIPDEVYNFTIKRGHLPYGVNIAGNIIDGEALPEKTDFKCAACGYNVILDDACYCPWCGEEIIYPHSII